MVHKLFDLTGKKALVTGSSRGIGMAIAMGLAECSADVVIHGSGNIARVEETASMIEKFGHKVCACVADLSKPDGARDLYRQVINRMGEIDILILNASAQFNKDWREITHEDFEIHMNVNVRASLELMQLFVPAMERKKWGWIITVGSVQQTKPRSYMMIYAASKMAQLSIVKNLAKELAPVAITVNNIASRVIDTDRNKEALSDVATLERLLHGIPVGEIGRPEDCVGTVL
jgi:glucose 1-dehydrogenase